MNMTKQILISDPTLRDGNHAVRHQLSRESFIAYCKAAEAAGVPIVEVGHGNGLGASSLLVGECLLSDCYFFNGLNWCCLWESNSRHPTYKAGALPTELRQQNLRPRLIPSPRSPIASVTRVRALTTHRHNLWRGRRDSNPHLTAS